MRVLRTEPGALFLHKSGLLLRNLGIRRYILGLYREYIGIMEKKMETTII